MPRLQTDVRVASAEQVVVNRFNAAIDDPSMIVSWFTATDSVNAEVEPAGDRSWSITVEADAFRARGLSVVGSASGSASVNIEFDIKPSGFLGRTLVSAALASGQVESTIHSALWREFGRPGEEIND